MILLDSDVLVDLLRKHPPAIKWFDTLDESEEVAVPGYVVMETFQPQRANRAAAKASAAVATCHDVIIDRYLLTRRLTTN